VLDVSKVYDNVKTVDDCETHCRETCGCKTFEIETTYNGKGRCQLSDTCTENSQMNDKGSSKWEIYRFICGTDCPPPPSPPPPPPAPPPPQLPTPTPPPYAPYPPLTTSKITAPDGAEGDGFGSAVAVSGSSVVVGAKGDDDNGSSSGSAYLFHTDGAFEKKLTAPDGAGGDNFGLAVAVSGSSVVVGAPGDDDNGVSSGSSYLFHTNGAFVKKLTAPGGAAYDSFGSAVAVSGSSVVVGAFLDDPAGSAYLFHTNGAFVKKLTAPDGLSGDSFGYAVAVSGSSVVVGAKGDDDNGSASGSAYLFHTNGAFEKKLTAPDGLSGDNFGLAVAVSGSSVVVGANLDDDNGFSSGSAYLFHTNDAFVKKLTAPDGAEGDGFGYAVAVSGSSVVVGAKLDDDNGFNSGSAYLFHTDGVFVEKLTAPDGLSGDKFGSAVAVSGSSVVVGVQNPDAAAAYLMSFA